MQAQPGALHTLRLCNRAARKKKPPQFFAFWVLVEQLPVKPQNNAMQKLYILFQNPSAKKPQKLEGSSFRRNKSFILNLYWINIRMYVSDPTADIPSEGWAPLSVVLADTFHWFSSSFYCICFQLFDLLSNRFVLRPNPNHVDKCLSLASSLCLVKQRSFWCCSTSATVSEAEQHCLTPLWKEPRSELQESDIWANKRNMAVQCLCRN